MGGDVDWVVVAVVGAHVDAVDGLEGGVGDGDGVGIEGECFYEVGVRV